MSDDEPECTPAQIIEGLEFAADDIAKMAFALKLHVPVGLQGGGHEIDQMLWRAKAWINSAVKVLGSK